MSDAAELAGLDLPDRVEFTCLRNWQQEVSKHRFQLELGGEETVFEGHFPGRPILPGIIQLHWAVSYAHYFLNRSEQPSQVSQLKFKKVFIPPGTLEIELLTGTSLDLVFRTFSPAGDHAQGKLLYGS